MRMSASDHGLFWTVLRESVRGRGLGGLPPAVRWLRASLLCLAAGLACSAEVPPSLPVSPSPGVPQAIATDLQICGFPEDQFDTSREGPPSYLTPQGKIHLGQRIPLELRGNTATLRALLWVIEPKFNSSVTHATWVSTSRQGATLVGTRVSSADFDYTFALARATFLDGTEKGLPIAICKSDSWRPVHQIVVIP